MYSQTPWPFRKILRDLLHTSGFHFQFPVSKCLWRRLCRCQRTYLRSPRDLAFRSCLDTSGVLVFDIRIFQISELRFRRRDLVSFITCAKGIQISWRECFVMVSDVQGSLLPDFLFCFLMTEKGSMEFLPFYLAVFLVHPHLLLIVQRRIYSNRGNRIMWLVMFFYFYHQLTLSRSDFAKKNILQLSCK